jgi:hypothetical protein
VSVADRAGNTASAVLTLAKDILAPSVAVDTPSAVGLSVRVSWAGVDIGSGIHNYDVDVKEGSGSWTDLYDNAVGTQASFIGESGKTYTFRVQAGDKVNNVSGWVESEPVEVGAAVTKYYTHGSSRACPEPIEGLPCAAGMRYTI